MKKLLLLLLLAPSVYAADHTVLGDPSGNDNPGYNGKYSLRLNSDGQVTTTVGSCEDQTNGVCRVEVQGLRCNGVTADAACKSAAGFLYSVTCAGTDAAATAGDVTIRDSTSAGAGTVVQTIGIAAAYQNPFTVWINAAFTTGIYLDFTTTADVMCSASYR